MKISNDIKDLGLVVVLMVAIGVILIVLFNVIIF